MRLIHIIAVIAASLTPTVLVAAPINVFGLESVKLDRVFDPDARPEFLRLVSGSLKLTGGTQRGNVWEAVIYVPQRTAAPRSDRGIYVSAGNLFRFYSFLTFGTYTGKISEDGEQFVIRKVTRDGRSQTEVWYIVR